MGLIVSRSYFSMISYVLLILMVNSFSFARAGLGTSYDYSSTSTRSVVKDYDPDSSLNLRSYDELKLEIRDNLLKVGVFANAKKKIVIYVWDFNNKSGYRVGASKIKDDISTILLETGKFRLVEDVVVEMALKEMNLSSTGFIDQNDIKEFGKRLGVEYILYGSINNNPLAGGEPNISLVLKLIEIETTQVIWSYEIGMNRKDFKTSLDAVIDEAIYKNPNSLLSSWKSINEEAISSYGKGIKSISVFFINTGMGIDDTAAVDKMTSALVQANIPGVRVVDRANLSRIIDQISKEGYKESVFFATRKEFGKFYSVDAFLYGVLVKDEKTGRTELNLKLAMVESATIDWARKFQAYMTSAERESIGKMQQKEFSEGVSKTVSATVGAVGEVLGFILSAPGIGVRLGGGWLGGFTTPGMTSKSLYNNYELFENATQILSFNFSIDFLRLRIWEGTFIETGFKLWFGSYTPLDDSSKEVKLTSASFNGRLLYTAIRYAEPSFFLRVSIFPLIEGLSIISSKVSYQYDYIYKISDTIETKVPNGVVFSPWNWPIEFEFGVSVDDAPPYISFILGFWDPGDYMNNISDLEWEFGINIVIPILWWHPMSFLYDKYLTSY
ncbi:MAG: penicillin-binding protein activator LpoB [Brevinematales bacterium]|nr:penicillin-binding protein activator LpoB [Brevinematales bacterium]